MGTRDNKRSPRTTKRFDTSELAALTSKLVDETGPVTHAEPLPVTSRTATLHDPMTTELLAEVARRSQTIEIDDELIDKVLESIDPVERAHPHTRRRG